MSIEFPCARCGQTLRTPAGTEGKQAKCPQCGALMAIPAASTSAFAAPPREPEFHPAGSFAPPPRQETGNPFQSPGAEQVQAAPAPRTFQPSLIDFSTVFDRSWQLYKRNFGLLAGCGVIVFVLSLLLNAIVQQLFGLNSQRFMVGFEFRVEDGPSALRSGLAGLALAAINAYFFLGMILVTLKVARAEGATVSDLFGGGPLIVSGVIVYWIVSVLTGIGMIFCILPGVWVFLTLGLSMHMLVDQRTGMIDSLRYSARAMQGNKLVGLGLVLVMIGLTSAVSLLTCFVGLPLVMPFAVLMTSVAYLSATGQLPADPERHPVSFAPVA